MKGLLLVFSLFFALCYSTNVYLTAYSAPSCDAATGYAVLKFNLTSGSCFNSGSGGLLLNTDGSVSFFSNANCSGNLTFSVASGSACANGTFGNYQSFSQMVTPGVYIQTDLYQNQNCSTPTYPFKTYFLNGTCFSVNSTYSFSYVAAPAPNITYYYFISATCSSSFSLINFVPGCNAVGKSFLNIGIQDLPVLTTTGATTGSSVTGTSVTGSSVTGSSSTTGATTGSSVTGTSVTGSSVTGSSVTGSSVTGSSVTGTSITGSSVTGSSVTGTSVTGSSVTGSSSTTGAGSTTGSSSSNDSNVFYPSLFLLVSLFLTSLF